jgi:hypothetical protein
MLHSRWTSGNSALKTAARVISSSGFGPDDEALRNFEVLRQDGLDFVFQQGAGVSGIVRAWTYVSTLPF